MAGPTDYAVFADVKAYVPDLDAGTDTAMVNTLLEIASREVDDYTDRYFWSDGTATKYFNGEGGQYLYLASHDFYSLTALKVATFENGDPATSDWVTLDGDGITPPSNFYAGPQAPPYAGVDSDTHLRPFYVLELPTAFKANSTNLISEFTAGLRTVGVTANWGWPVVPSRIKDVVVAATIRRWKNREMFWTGDSNTDTLSSQRPATILFPEDLDALESFRRHRAS